MLKAVGGILAALIGFPVFLAAVALGGESRATTTGPSNVPGIDPVLLDAYQQAAANVQEHRPDCEGMRWQILAGIGYVETRHANGHTISPSGDVTPRILGPRLDGSGVGGNTTAHSDTDGGRWDDDTQFDRAVGPMQFIPQTWASTGISATSGEPDPHNAFDAALSAAAYLCGHDPADLTDDAALRDAIYRYNRAGWYVDDVMERITHYDTIPDTTGVGSGGSDAGRAAAEWALEQVGKPYLWGGNGPDAFDCSGLTQQAWSHAGVSIPRVTIDQINHGTPVDEDDLAPGDLLFYDTTDGGAPGPPPSHVTMYIGNGQMVNAPSTGNNIRTEPTNGDYYAPRYMGARRPS